MTILEKVLINPSYTIVDAMKIIDVGALQIAIVVDAEQKLVGIVTDGDIRRGLLKGAGLTDPVSKVMNRNPTSMKENESILAIKKLLKQKNFRHIPIVDENNKVIDLKLADSLMGRQTYDNLVVLMAGGLGSRLSPLTDEVPKPLLKVGDKPILETIIKGFSNQGYHNFVISVNYKKELIKDYFGDGSNLGVTITYLDEDKRLGTAGALSLLVEKPSKPMIVMNGDLLTKTNFEQLLHFHEEYHSDATMCVREYEYQIPYGVVKTKNQQLVAIEEKPIERYFVNAGIYILNPNVLDVIPFNIYYDMPQLFEKLISMNRETAIFPIREYWMDIGKLSDYNQANLEYDGLFN